MCVRAGWARSWVRAARRRARTRVVERGERKKKVKCGAGRGRERERESESPAGLGARASFFRLSHRNFCPHPHPAFRKHTCTLTMQVTLTGARRVPSRGGTPVAGPFPAQFGQAQKRARRPAGGHRRLSAPPLVAAPTPWRVPFLMRPPHQGVEHYLPSLSWGAKVEVGGRALPRGRGAVVSRPHSPS